MSLGTTIWKLNPHIPYSSCTFSLPLHNDCLYLTPPFLLRCWSCVCGHSLLLCVCQSNRCGSFSRTCTHTRMMHTHAHTQYLWAYISFNFLDCICTHAQFCTQPCEITALKKKKSLNHISIEPKKTTCLSAKVYEITDFHFTQCAVNRLELCCDITYIADFFKKAPAEALRHTPHQHPLGKYLLSRHLLQRAAVRRLGCCLSAKCVMSRVWMSIVAHMDESCRTCVWMSHVAHMQEPFHTHMDKSRHTR